MLDEIGDVNPTSRKSSRQKGQGQDESVQSLMGFGHRVYKTSTHAPKVIETDL